MTNLPNHTTSSETSAPLKSAVDQFIDALAQRGLKPPTPIETDGLRHYFSSHGQPGYKNEYYEFHEGEIAYGAFGNARTGLRVDTWVADIGRPLTPDERSEIAKKREANRTDRKAQKEDLQAKAQRKADYILRAATPAQDTHRYLEKKKIKANGLLWWDDAIASVEYNEKTQKPFLRVVAKNGQAYVVFALDSVSKSEEELCQTWKSMLIVPMRDASGELQSLQFISKSGEKRFLYGGRMQGSYHVLGDLKDSETILVAEGLATAATVYEITGHPVVVAFNAGNLLVVTKAIRKQKPKAAIFVCADDDFKVKGNPGLTKAAQAAQAIGGTLLAPDFGPDRPDSATDFNDMVALLGKDAVTAFFTRHSLVTKTKTEAGVDNGAGGRDPALNGSSPVETTPERPAASSGKKRKAAGRGWGGMLTPSGSTP